MGDRIWTEELGEGPLVAVALHAGHAVRDEVGAALEITEADRLREEDPYTDRWTVIAPTRIVGLRSRFEVDLNRARERAVYRTPEDAWGLRVWRNGLDGEILRRSLAGYDAFYARMRRLLSDLRRRCGRFVVLDLHSYNHRRAGPQGPPGDEASNPQVNLGTGTMDRGRWGPVVNRFIDELRAADFPGGPLDVRENVRFRGGHLARWVHETFPDSGCVLAIEVRKFFMDEWSGAPDEAMIGAVGAALAAAAAAVTQELDRP
jgi:N-formylglutamate amidohydrolase